jgi:glycosyltransferase involved in cell wall biosynthesis
MDNQQGEGQGMRIAFLCAFVPYPLRDGDCVRADWMLRSLAKKHQVHGFFLDPDGIGKIPPEVSRHCVHATRVPVSRLDRLSGLVQGLFQGWPFNASGFISMKAMKTFHRMAAAWKIQGLHVHRLRMMPYALNLKLPYILDATDSISHYFKVARRGLPGWRKLYAWVDYPGVRQYERKWAEGAAATLVTTGQERGHILGLGVPTPVIAVPNGLDLRKYPFRSPLKRGKSLLFIGNMGYPPNIAGLEWFLKKCAYQVAIQEPETRLVVVGRGVPRRLRKIAGRCGMEVEFTGFVEDAVAQYHRAAALVCSLPVAAGIQNKAIQAFACGTPVVATANVAESLGGRHGRELLAAADPEAFTSQVVKLLRDGRLRERLARAAHRYARQAWPEAKAGLGLARAEAFLAKSIRGNK